jgi:hypothetical protein
MDKQLLEAQVRRLERALADASASRGAVSEVDPRSAASGAGVVVERLPPDPEEVSRLVDEGVRAFKTEARRQMGSLKIAHANEREEWRRKSADQQARINVLYDRLDAPWGTTDQERGAEGLAWWLAARRPACAWPRASVAA